MLNFKAKRRGIELITEISDEVPKTIKTDPNRLKQIINNLVGNSLKFTFEGHILIRMKNIASDHTLI